MKSTRSSGMGGVLSSGVMSPLLAVLPAATRGLDGRRVANSSAPVRPGRRSLAESGTARTAPNQMVPRAPATIPTTGIHGATPTSPGYGFVTTLSNGRPWYSRNTSPVRPADHAASRGAQAASRQRPEQATSSTAFEQADHEGGGPTSTVPRRRPPGHHVQGLEGVHGGDRGPERSVVPPRRHGATLRSAGRCAPSHQTSVAVQSTVRLRASLGSKLIRRRRPGVISISAS